MGWQAVVIGLAFAIFDDDDDDDDGVHIEYRSASFLSICHLAKMRDANVNRPVHHIRL